MTLSKFREFLHRLTWILIPSGIVVASSILILYLFNPGHFGEYTLYEVIFICCLLLANIAIDTTYRKDTNGKSEKSCSDHPV